jgi:hypothetical protein
MSRTDLEQLATAARPCRAGALGAEPGDGASQARTPLLTVERQRALADTVGKTARAELAKARKRKTAKASGTRMARNHGSSGDRLNDLRPDRDSNAGPTA